MDQGGLGQHHGRHKCLRREVPRRVQGKQHRRKPQAHRRPPQWHASKYVPSKLSRTRIDLPWLTPDLKRKCRRNQRLYNKAKKSGKDKHKEHYKSSRKATRAALKQARWRYINESLQTGLEEGHSKPFWKYVRSQKQDNRGVSALKKQGQLHSDRQAKCDILAEQFRSDFYQWQGGSKSRHQIIWTSNLVVNWEGVKKRLFGINPINRLDRTRHPVDCYERSPPNWL